MSLARTLAMLGLIATLSSLAACGKSEEAATPKSSLTGPARVGVDRVLASYEQIRATLAQDRAKIRAPSLQLAGAAQVAMNTAPETLRKPLADLSSSSQKLATMITDDVDEVRVAFGEVSRAVVAMLAAEPSLREGRYVFECPMVDGYKKWVQTSEKISNPYMGTKMPACGTESSW